MSNARFDGLGSRARVFVLLSAAAVLMASATSEIVRAQPPAAPPFDPDGGLFGDVTGVVDDDGIPGPSAGDSPWWPESQQGGLQFWAPSSCPFVQFGPMMVQFMPPPTPASISGSDNSAPAGFYDLYTFNGTPIDFDRLNADDEPVGATVVGVPNVLKGNRSADLALIGNGDGTYGQVHMSFSPDLVNLSMDYPAIGPFFSPKVILDLKFADTNSDGKPDFASIGNPLQMVGADPGDFDCQSMGAPSMCDCLPYDVWVPLVDNGDGYKRLILNDPMVLPSPPLAAFSVLRVPTLGSFGLAAFVGLLGVAALVVLRRFGS